MAFERDMDAADLVVQPAVAVVVEHVTGDPWCKKIRPCGRPRHLAKLCKAQPGRPAARGVQPNVPPIIERIVREQRLVHAIDEVRAGIGQALALYSDVKIPGWPPVRHAGHGLKQLVHIAEPDPWL